MDEYVYEQEQVGDYTVKVILDQHGDADNPLEYEEVFAITYRDGSRYTLGNEAVSDHEEWLMELAREADPYFEDYCDRIEERAYDMDTEQAQPLYAQLAKRRDKIIATHYVMAPVFAYIHSGVALSMGGGAYPFTCPWDGGLSGFIYASKAKLREMMMTKRLTKPVMAKITKTMESVVGTFGAWLNGEVYGYVVEDEDGDTIDSCWGFIGEPDYAMEQGKDHARWQVEQDAKKISDFCERAPLAVAAAGA